MIISVNGGGNGGSSVSVSGCLDGSGAVLQVVVDSEPVGGGGPVQLVDYTCLNGQFDGVTVCKRVVCLP